MAQDGLNVPPRLVLSILEGPCAGTEVAAAKGFRLTVGRTKTSKLHIKDSSVSEKHACIAWNGQHWALRDTDSSNGTAVNNRPLQPLVDVALLKDGDQVLFGLESRALVKLQQRTVGELTVEQLLASVCEAHAQRVEALGVAQAAALSADLTQAKVDLTARVQVHAAAA